MVYPVTYTFAGASVAYICALQTRTGAGALVLNGTGVDQTSTQLLNNPRMLLSGSGFERTVSITSTGVLTGVNFTIVGKDIRGAAISETRAGPSNSTVYTTAFFYEVDSVSVSATVGTSVSLGIGTTGRSQWYIVDPDLSPVQTGFGISVSSTDITWGMKSTTFNVQTAEPPAYAITDITAGLTAQTTSMQVITPVFGAARCLVTASTSGSLTLNINQAGIS